MLREWGAVNDGTVTALAGSYPPHGPPPHETDEAREGRLRAAYADALQLHADRHNVAARDAYQALAAELAAATTATEPLFPSEAAEAAAVAATTATTTVADAIAVGPRSDGHESRLVGSALRKRPRHRRSPPRGAAEWTRVMRYAVRRNLGDLLVDQGEAREAMYTYAAALDDDPEDVAVWLRAGRAALACGHLHVARRALDQALYRRPDHWRCVEENRRVLLAIGDADEDVTAKRNYAPAQPSDSSVTAAELFSHVSTADIVRARYMEMQNEKKIATAARAEIDSVHVSEPTWMALVVALGSVLKRRLSVSKPSLVGVGAALRVELRSAGDVEEFRMEDVPKNEATNILDMPVEKAGKVKGGDESEGGVMHAIDIPGGLTSSVEVTPSDRTKSVVNIAETTPCREVDDSSLIVNAEPLADVEYTEPVSDQGRALSAAQSLESEPRNKAKPQEIRKSKRQLELGREQRREQLRMKEITLGERSKTPVTWNISEQMLALVPDVPMPWTRKTGDDTEARQSSSDSTEEGCTSSDVVLDVDLSTVLPGVTDTAWNRAWSEAHEAEEVNKFVTEVASIPNGGPLDLLHRILAFLIDKASVQYMSHIARAWLLVQPHYALSSPGSTAVTAFVIESLLVSGDKTGKNKRVCFQEAKRLLTVQSDLLAHGFSSSVDISEIASLSSLARMNWISSQLAERSGDVAFGFDCAKRCFQAVSRLRDLDVENIPIEAGPLLAGMNVGDGVLMLKQASSLLYHASELNHARSCLSNAKKHQDPLLAKPAIRMLSRAIRNIARALFLDPSRAKFTPLNSESVKNDSQRLFLCNVSDIATAAQGSTISDPSSKALVTVISQLDVYQEACSTTGDSAGELSALAIRVKILAAQHDQLELAHCLKVAQPDKDLHVSGSGSYCATGKLASIVATLRKFVAAIKKVAGLQYSRVPCVYSDWSSSASMSIAAKALVAASRVLEAKIPPVGTSLSTPLELSAAQKNQRLAFTRAMLGFSRCVAFIVQGEEKRSGPLKASNRLCRSTSHILNVLSFALHMLVPRGCVREEGTSGALIRFYLNILTQRLSEFSILCSQRVLAADQNLSRGQISAKDVGGDSHDLDLSRNSSSDADRVHGRCLVAQNDNNENGFNPNPMCADERKELSQPLSHVDWDDVSTLRREMAQCYGCLYKLPDLEALASDSAMNEARWLVEGCSLSRRLGLSFAGDSAPVKMEMDVESCCGAFGFYRKYMFEALSCQWRDGKKSRRARDIVVELAETLPVEFPPGVPCVPLPVLDAVVSLGLESGRAAIATLKNDWEKAVLAAERDRPSTITILRCEQFSRMYYEVYVLHVLTVLSTYESEFKKQKVVERRKVPKEVVERLINAASNDCVGALRSRPWSPGAWILLGRVFLEVADVALDERAVASSTFGLCRNEDLASGDLDDPVIGILGRAEGCFRLAEALAKEMWVPDPSSDVAEATKLGLMDADAFDESILSSVSAKDHLMARCPLPDLFAQFGFAETGSSSSRSVRAAAHFGKASVLVMKLREERFRSRHWQTSTIMPRPIVRKSEKFPHQVTQLAVDAMRSLEKGLRYILPDSNASVTLGSTFKGGSGTLVQNLWDDSRMTADDDNGATISEKHQTLSQYSLNASSLTIWYYMMMRAKLSRKRGDDPKVYIPLFADAMEENVRIRTRDGEKPDIEPFYQLHATRMKVLLEHDGSDLQDICALLVEHSFEHLEKVVEVGVESVISNDKRYSPCPSGLLLRRAVGEDIAKAMTFCRQQKGSHALSEFYFKAVYAKSLTVWKILGDPKKAIEELNSMFRSEAAAKAIDPGSDVVHRGYFFTIWNYRHSDTGYEVALETERKYLRWRDKLLGLLGALLREIGDLRRIAGIISRLKRRHPDDLPIDGALLDDLVCAHAEVSLRQVLSFSQSGKDKPTVAVSEWLVRNAWDVFVETIRLAQGVKRVRLFVEREPGSACGTLGVVRSCRPWCLVIAACSLHAEYVRLQAAMDGKVMEPFDVQKYPVSAEATSGTSIDVFKDFAGTIKLCLERWPVDPKLAKLIHRRVEEYEDGGPAKSLGVNNRCRPTGRGKQSFAISPSDILWQAPLVCEHPEAPGGLAMGQRTVRDERCETIDLESATK
jgi:tetratricopeptide (TPR) repeat protein